jgi:hypothetical protein
MTQLHSSCKQHVGSQPGGRTARKRELVRVRPPLLLEPNHVLYGQDRICGYPYNSQKVTSLLLFCFGLGVKFMVNKPLALQSNQPIMHDVAKAG